VEIVININVICKIKECLFVNLKYEILKKNVKFYHIRIAIGVLHLAREKENKHF